MKINPLTFVRQNISYCSSIDAPKEEDLKKINYIMRQNGLWEVRKNSVATFYTHLCKEKLLGFPKEGDLEWREGFTLHVPKIPKVLLEQTIQFFKEICQRIKAEAYVQFVYNAVTREYKVICPKQEVSGSQVKYAPSKLEENELLVCEIHSHNTMDAFFSSTDDEDESSRGDRFFGVIGKLDRITPEIKMSFISGGRKRVIVEISDVFEMGQPISFPKEWMENVFEPKKITKFTATGKQLNVRRNKEGVIFEREIDIFNDNDYIEARHKNLELMFGARDLDEEYDKEDEDFDIMFYGGKGRINPKKNENQEKKKTVFRRQGDKK